MGDLNQNAYLKQFAHLARGPILEIGSRDYGNTPDYRGFFPSIEYLGADLSAGKGVDIVMDLSQDMATIDATTGGRRFGSIICFSVLEHCRDVFRVAQNLVTLLEPGGRIFISAPFSWEFHEFPDDYWRFSPSGIRALFLGLSFDEETSRISTSNVGEMKKIADKEFFKIDLAPGVGIQKKRYGRRTGIVLKVLKSFGLMPEILNHIYVMPPVSVSMIGQKSK